MSLTLNLEPELEQRLRSEAQRRGVPLEAMLQHELGERFKPVGSEAFLLQEITAGLPELFWQRYRELIGKRNQETLQVNEHLELIALSDRAEELSLQRTQALIELAAQRQTSVENLRVQLGLQPVTLES